MGTPQTETIYEYKTVKPKLRKGLTIDPTLNDFARDGWRVVAPLVHNGSSLGYLMERPVRPA